MPFLVYANQGDTWLPMMLYLENQQPIFGYVQGFIYSNIITVENVDFIVETYQAPYALYSRILFIDKNSFVLAANGTISYYHINEALAYNINNLPLIQFPMVSQTATPFTYNYALNLSMYCIGYIMGLANSQILPKPIIFTQQQIPTMPAVTIACPQPEPTEIPQEKAISQPEPTEITQEKAISQLEPTEITQEKEIPQAEKTETPKSEPELKTLLKPKINILKHVATPINATELQGMLKQYPGSLAQIYAFFNTRQVKSKSSKHIEQFIDDIIIPVEVCADLITRKKFSSQIKLAFLKKLLTFSDQEYLLIKDKTNFASIATRALKELRLTDNDLLKALKHKHIVCQELVEIKQVSELKVEPLIEKVETVEQATALITATKQQLKPRSKLLQALNSLNSQGINDILRDNSGVYALLLDSLSRTIAHISRNKFSLLEIFITELQVENIDFANLYAKISNRAQQLNTQLSPAINEKHQETLTILQNKISLLFAKLEAKEGNVVGIDNAEYELMLQNISQTNMHGQTFLMLSIQHGIKKKMILGLIEKSSACILKTDNYKQGVLHYWAQYYRSEYADLIENLYAKYYYIADLEKHDIFKLISAGADINGETYLHYLIRNKSEFAVLEALNLIFSLPNNMPLCISLFVKNSQQESIGYLLFNKEQAWDHVLSRLCQKIPQLVIDFCQKHPGKCAIYFTADSYWLAGGKDPIYNLPETKNYLRVIKTIEYRQNILLNVSMLLHVYIQKILVKLPNNSAAERLANLIIGFFKNDYLCEFHLRGQSIYGHVMEYVAKHGNSELEYMVKSKAFKDAKVLLPITETLEWKKLLLAIAKHDSIRVDKNIHNPLLELLTNKTEAVREAVDEAIISKKLALVKYLHEACGVQFCDRALVLVLWCAGDFELCDYVFDKHSSHNNLAEIKKLSSAMFVQTVLGLKSVEKTLWLIRRGFDARELFDDGKNIIQKLIDSVIEPQAENKIPLSLATELMEAVLFKPEAAEHLLSCKIGNGLSCEAYARKELGHMQKAETEGLFKLLKSNIIDSCLKPSLVAS